MIDAQDILGITKSVTKEWTKQRRAEERNNRSRSSRVYMYSDRVNFSDVADKILPAAYAHASGDGKYTVAKRQLYYACREDFKKRTARELKYNYFAETLLVQYMNRHSETTKNWKVTADPRGTLTIPNAGHEKRIPCGTLQIDDHLRRHEFCASTLIERPYDDMASKLDTEWPSLAASQRYQAVMYIEKEGFEPLLKEARIAERFDLAILSCKGQSVVAARRFVDEVCKINGGVPLFVVHDCDKSGFEISQCLTTVSDWAEENDRVTYVFRHKINVTDLGLRLADVEEYALASEECEFNGHFRANSICTPEEQEFLKSGRRVELNAFTSPQFVEWIEAKLTEHGLAQRLIPDDDVLEAAYRRALATARINRAIADATPDAIEQADEATVPKTLKRQLRKALKDSRSAWDKVLYRLVEEKIDDE